MEPSTRTWEERRVPKQAIRIKEKLESWTGTILLKIPQPRECAKASISSLQTHRLVMMIPLGWSVREKNVGGNGLLHCLILWLFFFLNQILKALGSQCDKDGTQGDLQHCGKRQEKSHQWSGWRPKGLVYWGITENPCRNWGRFFLKKHTGPHYLNKGVKAKKNTIISLDQSQQTFSVKDQTGNISHLVGHLGVCRNYSALPRSQEERENEQARVPIKLYWQNHMAGLLAVVCLCTELFCFCTIKYSSLIQRKSKMGVIRSTVDKKVKCANPNKYKRETLRVSPSKWKVRYESPTPCIIELTLSYIRTFSRETYILERRGDMIFAH